MQMGIERISKPSYPLQGHGHGQLGMVEQVLGVSRDKRSDGGGKRRAIEQRQRLLGLQFNFPTSGRHGLCPRDTTPELLRARRIPLGDVIVAACLRFHAATGDKCFAIRGIELQI